MNVVEIKNKTEWDKFVFKQKKHSFLHSWAWGELNEHMGDTVWRFAAYNTDKLLAVMLVIKVHAKRGNFLFVPQGPIIAEQTYEVLKQFTEHLKMLGKAEKVNFIRISPLLKNTQENKNIFNALGFRPAPIYMHAETTWSLDLNKSAGELLAGMRKTTRNLIGRATREDVRITAGTSEEDFKNFLRIYKTTANKQGFNPFSEKYLKTELDVFNGEAKIYSAVWQKQVLSSALIVFYGHSAYYHHGANAQEHTKIPAAYLLQWQAIQDAKQAGKQHYNFWGVISNEEKKRHPWSGLTFFKKGFGGYETEFMHAQDLMLKKQYWINYSIDTYRKWRRGV